MACDSLGRPKLFDTKSWMPSTAPFVIYYVVFLILLGVLFFYEGDNKRYLGEQIGSGGGYQEYQITCRSEIDIKIEIDSKRMINLYVFDEIQFNNFVNGDNYYGKAVKNEKKVHAKYRCDGHEQVYIVVERDGQLGTSYSYQTSKSLKTSIILTMLIIVTFVMIVLALLVRQGEIYRLLKVYSENGKRTIVFKPKKKSDQNQ